MGRGKDRRHRTPREAANALILRKSNQNTIRMSKVFWSGILLRVMCLTGLLWVASASDTHAQFATMGGGVLTSRRAPQTVAEVHLETPPFASFRAYATSSWTDKSWNPTFITAAERPVLRMGRAFTGFGPGLLWFKTDVYRAYPILVSSTVIPLPIPRASLVLIGSVQPFQDFEWSMLVKAGVTIWFRK